MIAFDCDGNIIQVGSKVEWALTSEVAQAIMNALLHNYSVKSSPSLLEWVKGVAIVKDISFGDAAIDVENAGSPGSIIGITTDRHPLFITITGADSISKATILRTHPACYRVIKETPAITEKETTSHANT